MRSAMLLWLPCISLPAWPLALAEPNAQPSNFGPRASAAWHRAGSRLASWAPADAAWLGPGPGRTHPGPPRRHRTQARRAPRLPSPRAKTPLRCETQGRAGGRYPQLEHAPHQHKAHTTRNCKYTGLPLTNFVSVDTGNANRESTEVGMQEYVYPRNILTQTSSNEAVNRTRTGASTQELRHANSSQLKIGGASARRTSFAEHCVDHKKLR